MNIEGITLITAVLVMGITIMSLKLFIPILASRKMGQKILEIGPRWHKNKEGTPTMGGIAFIFAIILSFIVFMGMSNEEIEIKRMVGALNVLIYAVLNAMIGIIDDFAKLRKARNEGLTPKSKFLLQSVVAVLFLISMKFTVGINTVLHIPFFRTSVDVGFFYYIIAFLALCGVVNSVNLTDGIDGLASGVVLSVGFFFCISSVLIFKDFTVSFFGASLIGASLGFLVYNFYPARVFMGDTGSLFLGALVIGVAFLFDNILLVILYGFVFLCEALSDILQVTYFKITKGKRLFKMAPLHHHFEKLGFSEVQITLMFTAVNTLFCILAYLGIK